MPVAVDISATSIEFLTNEIRYGSLSRSVLRELGGSDYKIDARPTWTFHIWASSISRLPLAEITWTATIPRKLPNHPTYRHTHTSAVYLSHSQLLVRETPSSLQAFLRDDPSLRRSSSASILQLSVNQRQPNLQQNLLEKNSSDTVQLEAKSTC